MTTIYKLTRCLSGECELIHLSTDRQHLADLMRADIDKWTEPVTYTIEITFDFDELYEEGRSNAFQDSDLSYYKTGRVNAFREAGELFNRLACTFHRGGVSYSNYRMAACKMFALMEEECSE